MIINLHMANISGGGTYAPQKQSIFGQSGGHLTI